MSSLNLVRADFAVTIVCSEHGMLCCGGVDISFEASFFVVFRLEGVSLKAGANTSVSTHPCELH